MSEDASKIGPPIRGDVRSALDKNFLFSYDLQGRDVVVTIERVVQGELVGQQGRKTKKPVVFFKGKSKPLALNITNIKTIASLYGSFRVEDWIGKSITLYPTTTNFGSETRDCIRIRNKRPGTQQAAASEPQQREPGGDDGDGYDDDAARAAAAPGPGEMP